MRRLTLLIILVAAAGFAAPLRADDRPYLLVLGIAQDGGVPQAGSKTDSAWNDPSLVRHPACLAIVDPPSGERWMIDCTPSFPEQLHALDEVFPVAGKPGLSGIFLTHAHVGHYAGLIHLGHEVMGADSVPVYAMPRMFDFLATNGPWSQLVHYGNIALRPLRAAEPVQLNDRLRIMAFRVPHRQEYSEVVGYRIRGPSRTVLYIPDIDSWEEWAAQGSHIAEEIARVDLAYLDATFFANGEIPGRDMSAFPHPFIVHTMEILSDLPASERAKVRFIHLNHTNPALDAESDARRTIEAGGFRVAEEGERVEL